MEEMSKGEFVLTAMSIGASFFVAISYIQIQLSKKNKPNTKEQ